MKIKILFATVLTLALGAGGYAQALDKAKVPFTYAGKTFYEAASRLILMNIVNRSRRFARQA